MLNNWIKKTRISKGFTLDDVARRSGTPKGLISRLENKRSEITLLAIVRVFYGLDLSVTSLFSGGFVKKDLIMPSIYEDKSVRKSNYNCLNANDIYAILESPLTQRGRASSIVIALIEKFLSQCDLPLSVEKRELISSSAYSTLDSCGTNSNLLLSNLEGNQLCYPSSFSPDKLKQIYLSGGVFIFSDLGTYMQSLRNERGLSARQLAKIVDVSHPSIGALESKMGSRVKLNDLIKIDNALELNGELIVFAWRTAELYLGLYPKRLVANIPRQLQSHEVTIIERLVILSRLFQHHFPEDESWLRWYRDQSTRNFEDFSR